MRKQIIWCSYMSIHVSLGVRIGGVIRTILIPMKRMQMMINRKKMPVRKIIMRLMHEYKKLT
ncbi:hypothetical protein [Paenibacillus andongensis]|uniref:hypothetical protein n=1 Tax=Paenibacillus andongensis TaxID=2975482 RepID=UPI0021BB4405|nr:hypothetical protein [Paenibacillus andongensis]